MLFFQFVWPSRLDITIRFVNKSIPVVVFGEAYVRDSIKRSCTGSRGSPAMLARVIGWRHIKPTFLRRELISSVSRFSQFGLQPRQPTWHQLRSIILIGNYCASSSCCCLLNARRCPDGVLSISLTSISDCTI